MSAMEGDLVLVRTFGAPKYHAELYGASLKFFKSKSHVDDGDRVDDTVDHLAEAGAMGHVLDDDVDELRVDEDAQKQTMAVRTWDMRVATKAESHPADCRMFTVHYKVGKPSKLKAPSKMERNRWVSAITRAICVYNKADMHIALDAQKVAMENHFKQVREREAAKKEAERAKGPDQLKAIVKTNFPDELLSSRAAVLFAGEVLKLNNRVGKVRIYIQIRGRYLISFRSPNDARLVRRALVRDPGFSFLTEARIQSVWDLRRVVSVHQDLERKPVGVVLAVTLEDADHGIPFVKRIECLDKLQSTALHKALLTAKEEQRKKEQKEIKADRRQTSTEERFASASSRSLRMETDLPDLSQLASSSAAALAAEAERVEQVATARKQAQKKIDDAAAARLREMEREASERAARVAKAAAEAKVKEEEDLGPPPDDFGSPPPDDFPPSPATKTTTTTTTTKRPPSIWTAIKDPTSGREYYSSADGKVRWEPPPDLIPCPFNGGFWSYMTEGGIPSAEPIDLASLWSIAADGAISDETMVGLHGLDQFWPLKSILRRAMTVHHLFRSADADGDGNISTDEFTAWIKSEGGAMVDQQALDMIIIFQSMDSDQDGAISRIEFMCFLLQHSADVESLVKWIDSKW